MEDYTKLLYTSKEIAALVQWADDLSVKTSPFIAPNFVSYREYSGDDWTKAKAFSLYVYAYKMGDFLDQSNYETIKDAMESFDSAHWADESYGSWATPYYQITVYPCGQDGDLPFNAGIVEEAKALIDSLAQYPSLDDDRYSELESDWFQDELAFKLREYEDNDPIHSIVYQAQQHGSGEYEDFIYNVLPDIIKEYDQVLDALSENDLATLDYLKIVSTHVKTD